MSGRVHVERNVYARYCFNAWSSAQFALEDLSKPQIEGSTATSCCGIINFNAMEIKELLKQWPLLMDSFCREATTTHRFRLLPVNISNRLLPSTMLLHQQQQVRSDECLWWQLPKRQIKVDVVNRHKQGPSSYSNSSKLLMFIRHEEEVVEKAKEADEIDCDVDDDKQGGDDDEESCSSSSCPLLAVDTTSNNNNQSRQYYKMVRKAVVSVGTRAGIKQLHHVLVNLVQQQLAVASTNKNNKFSPPSQQPS